MQGVREVFLIRDGSWPEMGRSLAFLGVYMCWRLRRCNSKTLLLSKSLVYGILYSQKAVGHGVGPFLALEVFQYNTM